MFPFSPLSKSYERVFINDWGAASLNKWKVKGSISFSIKRLFLFSGMSHLGAASLDYNLVREFQSGLCRFFLFCRHQEKGWGIKSYLFSCCCLQIYCIQYLKLIIIKGFELPMGTVSWLDTYPKKSLALNKAIVERSGRWILSRDFLSFIFKQETHSGPAPWARWCFNENIYVP